MTIKWLVFLPLLIPHPAKKKNLRVFEWTTNDRRRRFTASIIFQAVTLIKFTFHTFSLSGWIWFSVIAFCLISSHLMNIFHNL